VKALPAKYRQSCCGRAQVEPSTKASDIDEIPEGKANLIRHRSVGAEAGAIARMFRLPAVVVNRINRLDDEVQMIVCVLTVEAGPRAERTGFGPFEFRQSVIGSDNAVKPPEQQDRWDIFGRN